MPLDVEFLYRKYGPMVLRRCRYLLKDEDEAMDAMQETFVRVLRKQDTLEDRGLSSLLYTIATRICLNVIRDRGRAPANWEEEQLQRIASAENLEERSVAGMFLDQLFGKQKSSTRTIAVLHYLDGMTLQETADAVGLSVSGVRKRLRNLRAAGLAMEGMGT